MYKKNEDIIRYRMKKCFIGGSLRFEGRRCLLVKTVGRVGREQKEKDIHEKENTLHK